MKLKHHLAGHSQLASSRFRSRRDCHRQLTIEALEVRRLLSAAVKDWGSLLAETTYHVLDGKGGENVPHGSSSPVGLTPVQVRHAYGFDQITFSGGSIIGDGAGQTVAIIDAFDNPKFVSSSAANYNTSDLHNFNVAFGLQDFGGAGNPTFTKVNQSGGTSYPGSNAGWAGEIALDVEWVHALAPKANIVLVEANTNSNTDLLAAAANWARNNASISVATMSFGVDGGFDGESSFDQYFTSIGHNITFFASSGDSGNPGGYPAESPNVVAVGGTNLTLGAGNAWGGEVGWSGSGGGISTRQAKPSYQSSVTQSASQRCIPDVAFTGGPNSSVAVYDSFNNGTSGPWGALYGTSLSSPCWAGLMAIVNQGRVINNQALYTSATALSAIYSLAASDFHDILSGNNGNPTGPGYDLVTGRGTPKAQFVVAELIGSPLPPPPPSDPSQADLATASDSGTSTTDNITNDNTPTFTGTADVSVTINLYAGGSTLLGTTTSSASDGTWSITPSTMLDGTYSITATATSGSGTSNPSSPLSITIDTVAPPTPGVPDLAFANDSGFSHFDNITNITNPSFSGSAETGATVRLYANGVQKGAATGSGASTYNIVSGALANGTYSMTANSFDLAGNFSGTSNGLSVTIDTVRPTISSTAFNYLTSQQLVYTFSEAMNTLPAALNGFSVAITDTATLTDLDQSNFAESTSAGNTVATFSFPGFANSSLPDGNYQASVSGVQDVAGNLMLVDPSTPFSLFALGGDADRSKTVDTVDFSILAADFGLTGQNFAQGDFNYDGSVDTIDFSILASNFSKSLAAPAAAAPPSGRLFGQTPVDPTLVNDVL